MACQPDGFLPLEPELAPATEASGFTVVARSRKAAIGLLGRPPTVPRGCLVFLREGNSGRAIDIQLSQAHPDHPLFT